jgi:hypothetical protein
MCLPQLIDVFDNVTNSRQLLGKLKQWPSVVQNFRKLEEDANADPAPIQVMSSDALSTNNDQNFFATGLRILAQANSTDVRKDYHKVKYNIGVMAFSLWWFLAVCVHIYSVLPT